MGTTYSRFQTAYHFTHNYFCVSLKSMEQESYVETNEP